MGRIGIALAAALALFVGTVASGAQADELDNGPKNPPPVNCTKPCNGLKAIRADPAATPAEKKQPAPPVKADEIIAPRPPVPPHD
jgi:hypothetical protein